MNDQFSVSSNTQVVTYPVSEEVESSVATSTLQLQNQSTFVFFFSLSLSLFLYIYINTCFTNEYGEPTTDNYCIPVYCIPLLRSNPKYNPHRQYLQQLVWKLTIKKSSWPNFGGSFSTKDNLWSHWIRSSLSYTYFRKRLFQNWPWILVITPGKNTAFLKVIVKDRQYKYYRLLPAKMLNTNKHLGEG